MVVESRELNQSLPRIGKRHGVQGMFKPSESLTDRIISLEAERDNLRILLFDPELPEHLKENIRLALNLAEAELNRLAELGSQS
jgi:hypothetical protein